MNTRRSATCTLSAALSVLVFSGALAGQGPLLPTLPRLDALKLASIEGDVPVRYSRSVSRDVARAIASRIADCRSLLGAAAGRPSIVLAVLDAPDWKRVTERPYGMAHHVSADSPNVIVIPRSWRDAAPRFTAVRTHLAGAVGEHDVDRFVHLIALHELGHLFTNAALSTTTEAIRTRFPFWYGEFLANYFADACLARQPEESAFRRRGAAALASIPRQRFTALADSDRLLTEKDSSGLYLTTEAGGLNFARYQGFTSQMASRLRDAGLDTTRLLDILRQQWARPGRQKTDVLLKDFAGIAPGWDEWLVEQGAIAGPRKRLLTSEFGTVTIDFLRAAQDSLCASALAIVGRRESEEEALQLREESSNPAREEGDSSPTGIFKTAARTGGRYAAQRDMGECSRWRSRCVGSWPSPAPTRS